MPGVGRLDERIPRRVEDQRPTERQEDALPELDRRGRAMPPLERADRRLNDAASIAKGTLGQPPATTRLAYLPTEPSALLATASRGFGIEFAAPRSRHIAAIVVGRACHAVS
jgi:hypothetical protein